MTQPRFHRAQPRLIVIHCLYLAELNPVLRIGTIAHMVERRNDDLECSTKLDAPTRDVLRLVWNESNRQL